jgi:hypothetical protein
VVLAVREIAAPREKRPWLAMTAMMIIYETSYLNHFQSTSWFTGCNLFPIDLLPGRSPVYLPGSGVVFQFFLFQSSRLLSGNTQVTIR